MGKVTIVLVKINGLLAHSFMELIIFAELRSKVSIKLKGLNL